MAPVCRSKSIPGQEGKKDNAEAKKKSFHTPLV
jgi:hypothetical protein